MKMDDYATTDKGTGIYGYLNLKTNEIDYVGKTSMSFRLRDQSHRRKHNDVPFDYKLRVHPDKYIMIPLAYCDDVDSLDLLETFYIYHFNTIDKDNYNWGGYTLREKRSFSFRNNLDNKEIRRLYIEEGLSTYQIGEKFGVSDRTISNRLKKLKVKLRGRPKNTSNYYRVHKAKIKTTKQGFVWVYAYNENNKKKQISSVNFETLKKKVQAKGLPWYKINNR